MTTKSFENLVLQFSESLYRFSYSIVQNQDLAKDVVQDVFIKLWNNNEQDVKILNQKAFLFQLVKNKSIDVLRSEQTRKQHESKSILIENQEQNDLDNEKLDLINTMINQLPAQQKEVLILRDFEGFAYAEIAESLSLSLPQVKVLIFRARSKLKELIAMKEKHKIKNYG